jgi:hypothetical protein
MAKALTKQTPGSAVSRFLEPGVGRAALTDRDRAPVPASFSAAGPGETPHIKREFILTPAADDTLAGTVRCLSRATGTNVSNSHFLRSLLKAVAHALPELEREASQIGRLKRPGNARGKEACREGYEEKLAEALLAALRAWTPKE